MTYLATLEGETENELLDRLFDTNDVLGVLVYGPETWNKVKNFVANLASKEISKNRGCFGQKYSYYKSNDDILDNVFGFNHSLGAALLGGENWGKVVNSCKSSAPTLGFSLSNLIKPVTNSIYAFVPKSGSAEDLLKWATGWQGVETAYKTAKDITGYSDYEAAQAEAKRQQEREERIDEELQKQYLQNLADLKKYEAEKENQLQIESVKAKAEAETALKSSPEYLAAQTKNLLIVGGIGIAAILLLSKKG